MNELIAIICCSTAIVITILICLTIVAVAKTRTCEIKDGVAERIESVVMSEITIDQKCECIKDIVKLYQPDEEVENE